MRVAKLLIPHTQLVGKFFEDISFFNPINNGDFWYVSLQESAYLNHGEFEIVKIEVIQTNPFINGNSSNN